MGSVAGALFALAALAAIAAHEALGKLPRDAAGDAVLVAALCTGLACFLVPWGRVSAAWLHVAPVVATAQIAAGVWIAGGDGEPFTWLYVLVVVFAAYAFASRLAVAGHVAFAAAALALPVIQGAEAGGEAVARAVIGGPALVLAATLVVLLRERLEAEKEVLRQDAQRDPLTGVGNYALLYDRLGYELARHGRHRRRFAVLVLDLDNFKAVNETFGHLMGDSVLRAVGRVLAETVRGQETVARQGGDEFSVLAPETDAAAAAVLTGRLHRGLAAIGVGRGWVSASIGFAVYPEDGETPEELMTSADAHLRAGKRRRRFGRPAGEPVDDSALSPVVDPSIAD